ncbi:MAG: ParA family protein [Bacteroidia bacterium]
MIITFANHKGGTGKTTSTINIGRALAGMGKRVLLVDLDPQGNLTYSLGLSDQGLTVADLLLQTHSFEEVACEASGMHILPANNSIYDKGKLIESAPGHLFLLRDALQKIKNKYHFILLDCSPSMTVYTFNALNAADKVIIPLVFEILSIQGLDQILIEINKIRRVTNPNLSVLGALGVIVNENRKLSQEVLEYIRDNYKISIFNNHVRNNVKAAEAPSFGESVIDYAPASISAKDYLNVTRELLKIIETENQLA